ncbi:arylesterase [Chitinilyticum piscinae]|uniref:Arylesterase n=1 Tax=Chitinilyticum piscinae TaxID=2866724 RepID=A0A8J7K7U8_9NEIS|nr:arylesterase [Chitinilyticum piscinae]MBE9608623.1 arylesterase [Chitinilyticum piscinae]
MRHLLLCCLTILLVACGQPELPRLAQGATILAFGDSLTYGIGAENGADYPSRLAAQLGHPVINAGIPGETTAEGLARLPTTLNETRPALVLLCLGGNDFLQRKPEAETQRNLDAMLALLASRKVPVLLIGVPKLGFGLDTPPLYQALAEQHQVPLNDTALASILGRQQLKSDLVHPNAQGYQILADELASQLRELGAVR